VTGKVTNIYTKANSEQLKSKKQPLSQLAASVTAPNSQPLTTAKPTAPPSAPTRDGNRVTVNNVAEVTSGVSFTPQADPILPKGVLNQSLGTAEARFDAAKCPPPKLASCQSAGKGPGCSKSTTVGDNPTGKKTCEEDVERTCRDGFPVDEDKCDEQKAVCFASKDRFDCKKKCNSSASSCQEACQQRYSETFNAAARASCLESCAEDASNCEDKCASDSPAGASSETNRITIIVHN
jgi:hypothetical protein